MILPEGIANVDVEHNKQAAEWRLAEYLYFTMVKLDPSPDDQEWEQLTDKERRYYWHCIRAVLSRRKDVEAALH